MTEKMLHQQTLNHVGKVEIAPHVIETIVAMATHEVTGVYAMRGNFASGVKEKLKRESLGKGVKVHIDQEGIVLDVFVAVNAYVTMTVVANNIQHHIRATLKDMLELSVKEINVHIVGVALDKK